MKKSVSILVAIFLLIAIAVPAYATPVSAETISMEGGIISPHYIAINSISSFITMSGNTAICSAHVSQSGARANVRIILQRSTNGGSTFSDFATLLNKDYTTRSISAEASRTGLDTSFRYRTKVVVTVFDASGRQIDSGTAFS